MKILFIGPYRQLNNVGLLSRDYLKSLEYTNELDVISRPIYINHDIPTDNKIESYKNTEIIDDGPYDAIIQHVPHYMLTYNANYGKNYGILNITNRNIKWTNIEYRAKIMDGIFVGHKAEKESLGSINSHIINVPIDININTDTIEGFDNNVLKDTYKFYFIGDLSMSGNINTAIIAFLLEFSHKDNVSLIIYTDNPNIANHVTEIKKVLRKHENIAAYKEVTTIVGTMTEESRLRLHKTGDCFLVPSRSLLNSQEPLYAGLFKNNVIATNNIYSQLNNDNSWLIDSYLNPVLDKDSKMFDVNMCHELTMEPQVIHLQQHMRTVFEQNTQSKASKLYNDILAYNSYKAIGNNIKQCLIQ